MSRVGTKMRVSGAVNNSEAKANSSAQASMASFNLLEHPICLNYPSRVAVSAWMGHVPFAFYLIDVLHPKAIVELGTHHGVSYCAFCQAVKELGLGTRCYAIDSWEGDAQAGFYGPEVLAGLEEHHNPLYGGFSQLIQTTFDKAVEYFADDTFDLLHIDGYHTYEAVKQDFQKWLPKMTDRGVILFHDINVREREFGVWKFWDELKLEYPHFELVHSHGLGVLAVGELYPDELKRLFACSETEAASIRSFFSQLGAGLVAAQELQLNRSTIKELSAVVHEKSSQLLASDQQLLEKDKILKQTVQQLQEKEQQIRAKEEELLVSQQMVQSTETLNQQIVEKNEALKQTEQQLQEKEQQIRAKEEELMAKEQMIRSIEGLNQQLLAEQHKLSPQLELKDQQSQAQHGQLTELEDEIQELRRHLESRSRELELNALQITEYSNRLQEVTQSSEATEHDYRSNGQKGAMQIRFNVEQLQLGRDGLAETKLLVGMERQRDIRDEYMKAKDLQVREIEQRLGIYVQTVEEFRFSPSYRLGRVLTWPLRMIKKMLV